MFSYALLWLAPALKGNPSELPCLRRDEDCRRVHGGSLSLLSSRDRGGRCHAVEWGGLSGCHRCVEGAQHYKSLPPYEEDLQLLRQFPEHDLSHVCLACRGQGWGAHRLSPVSRQRMRCPTAPALPWVAWASLPHFPRDHAPRRRPPPRLRALRVSLASRYLACCRGFVVSPEGAWPGRKPQGTPGLVVTRSPMPGMQQGDRWLSHVPTFPLWKQAPLSDPGGVLGTRHPAPRTAACRSLATVGLPLATAVRTILWTTTLRLAGLTHAACLLATPGFVRPLTGRHAGALLTGWLGVRQVGWEPTGSHPLGNNHQFRGCTPTPKVLGFPWRDQCRVRLAVA